MDIFAQQELDSWLASSPREPATIVGLDLTAREKDFAAVDLAGSTLLGCDITAKIYDQVIEQRGAMISRAPGLPFNPLRTTPYSISDLYDRYDTADSIASWKRSFDYLNYAWFMDEAQQLPRALTTSQSVQARLHDTAMEGAVARFIVATGRPLVGFMGGHDTLRSAPVFATVAKLSRRLTNEGLLVLSGGGPGLMEASNLGAFMAEHDESDLDALIAKLAAAPKYDHPDWLKLAWECRNEVLQGSQIQPRAFSLGIPTWLYGFEPPNVFASHQAKMFFNSLREDGLVTLAGAGLVIGPGNAGTVQEIFQDATQNYYRKPTVSPTPIALLDKAFWTRPATDGPDPKDRTKPVEPLLMALAGEKPKTDWSAAVLITDDVDAIAELILKTAFGGGAATRGELWRAAKV